MEKLSSTTVKLGFWVDYEDIPDSYKQETAKEADEILHTFTYLIKLLRVPYLLCTLVSMRYSNSLYGDAIIRARLYLEDKFCILPSVSKVRNCGFDMSGINCPDDGGIHSKQQIDTSNGFVSGIVSGLNNEINLFNSYFPTSFKIIFKNLIKYCIYILRPFFVDTFDTNRKK